MANTRLVLSDYADPISYAPALLNSPDTASGYTASNIFTRDRHTAWKVGGSNVGTFDIDLGAAYSIDAIVVCGEDHASWGAASGPVVTAYYSDNAVSWSAVSGSIAAANWSGYSNGILSIATAVSRRYWRIVFTGSGTFSIGKLFLGNDTDLGFVYSQGTTRTLVRQRTRHNVNGALAIHELGPSYRRFGLRFDRVNGTTLSTLETAHGLGRPFVYIDKASRVWHVELDDDLLTRSHVFGDDTNDIYDLTLNLVELV
jgi:hypothetical protein